MKKKQPRGPFNSLPFGTRLLDNGLTGPGPVFGPSKWRPERRDVTVNMDGNLCLVCGHWRSIVDFSSHECPEGVRRYAAGGTITCQYSSTSVLPTETIAIEAITLPNAGAAFDER